MNVATLRGDVSGVSWHRMLNPIREMVRQGLIEISTTPDMLPVKLHQRVEAEARKIQQMYTLMCKDADVLHTQRVQSQELFGLLTALSKLHGLPYCMDIDDDIVAIDESNPAYNTYKKRTDAECYSTREIQDESEAAPYEIVGEQEGRLVAITQNVEDGREVSLQQVKQADALFTTTRDLALLYGNIRKSHKHIYVLPNSLVPAQWDSIEKPGDHAGEVWVGWAGSTSHIQDIHLLVDVAEHVLKTWSHTKFFWMKIPHPDLMSLARDYPERCIMYDGWAGVEDWPDYYASMNFDIALGPLVDTAFNRGKSNLKWLEAGILSQPFVASRVGPYASSIRNKKDGFLCNRPKDWIKALDALVGSKYLRYEVGAAARERVMSEFNMEKNCHMWVDAYEQVARDLGEMAQERTRSILEQVQA